MTVVHRRVFYGKVGQADKIVAALKQGDKNFKKFGVKGASRILTDNNCGRTDRVIWEMEAPSVAEGEEQMAKVMSSAEGQKVFGAWFARLSELIHYAEVDNLLVK